MTEMMASSEAYVSHHDGATALKLDLSLDTSIIFVPRNSTSKDFIQLDLGQLKVTNELSWYGSPEKDPSAVHIDVLHGEIMGINMSVGIDSCLGKSMIREGKGLDVYVRRSLRDVFKKVGLLHSVMSDKEYKVILDCAYMNLCEEPKLPPSFCGGKSDSKDTMRQLADKVNMNSQLLLSKTVTIVAVVIDHALLELPVPPSQAVMAVSNAYGRVRKPIGFNLIGLFSAIQGFGRGDSDNAYFLLHQILNLHLDLASGAWRMFLDHFMPILLLNALLKTVVVNSIIFFFGIGISIGLEPASNLAIDNNYASQQTRNQTGNSSGWDIVRSISKAINCFMATPNFERTWWDKGSDLCRPVSVWRPIARRGYAILGDCITEGLEPPAVGIIFKADDPEVSAKPVQFTKVAHVVGKGFDEVFFWYPLAPPGYASLGCIVSRMDEAPSVDTICCPRMDLVNQANILEVPISRSSTSKGSQCWSIWRVENQASTFLARADLKKPSGQLAYPIGDSMKPKTRENITAEVKLRCFSLTVLDSLCGMMTPLFDATITNIKLATHGRLEAINAVLISSIAASTFNTQLESWEPLLEPFDGIFKFETYGTNVHLPSKFGKTLRIAATSILNLNVSAAILETFIGSVLSWRKQLELEQKAMKISEESGGLCGQGEDQTFSALDEDDFQTVVVENKLGCENYVKRVEENSQRVDWLHHGDYIFIWVPPPRQELINVISAYAPQASSRVGYEFEGEILGRPWRLGARNCSDGEVIYGRRFKWTRGQGDRQLWRFSWWPWFWGEKRGWGSYLGFCNGI
ncbi:hypothetical protein ACFX2G_022182 [Malus domestica]